VTEDASNRLREVTVNSERVYEGKIINLRVDDVELPDGGSSKREIVEHRGAVAAVPITKDGEVILVRQWRHAAGRVMLEIPAGTREQGEDMIETMRRELVEEIGHRAGQIEPLAEVFVTPGYSTEVIGLYLATELEPAEGASEADEKIELVRAPLSDALEWCRDGELNDAKTVAGLLLAAMRLEQQGLSAPDG